MLNIIDAYLAASLSIGLSGGYIASEIQENPVPIMSEEINYEIPDNKYSGRLVPRDQRTPLQANTTQPRTTFFRKTPAPHVGKIRDMTKRGGRHN